MAFAKVLICNMSQHRIYYLQEPFGCANVFGHLCCLFNYWENCDKDKKSHLIVSPQQPASLMDIFILIPNKLQEAFQNMVQFLLNLAKKRGSLF